MRDTGAASADSDNNVLFRSRPSTSRAERQRVRCDQEPSEPEIDPQLRAERDCP